MGSAGNGYSTSIADDEWTLGELRAQKDALESRPHDGYADAAKVSQLEAEIEATEERISRRKQQAERGEG